MDRREIAAVTITVAIGLLAMAGLYLVLGILQDRGVEPVALLGVLIAAVAGAGAVYSYAKSRLDKLVDLLDQVRRWAIYPLMLTGALRSQNGTFGQDDRLQEVAEETSRNLAWAWGAFSPSLPEESQDVQSTKMEIRKEVNETLAMLHAFSVTTFTDDKELTESWQKVYDKLERLVSDLSKLKERSYRAKSWVPRWLGNKLLR
jgi:hypothetical protein